jgi:predicted kinase
MKPDRLELWWELAGPASILNRVERAVTQCERLIVLECPKPRPEGLVGALSRRLGKELALDTIPINLSKVPQTGSIAHLLCEITDVPATDITNIQDFASQPSLLNKVLLIDGLDKSQLVRWGLFLLSIRKEKVDGVIVGPVIILIPPCGLTAEQRKTLYGSAASCSTLGKVDRHDIIAHLANLGIRPDTDLTSRVGHSVMIEVAAWSRALVETMAAWDVDDQINPLTLLYRLCDQSRVPFPCWENGLVDLWDDEPVAHAVAALAHGLQKHIERRIWSAQAAVILPFVDRIRRGIIGHYRDRLDKLVSKETPYVRKVNEREIVKEDPTTLEFYEIKDLLVGDLSQAELDLIKIAKWARDNSAHMKISTPRLVKQLSDHYEANRESLENDIPGWDWPRAGQMMTMTIGPSAAGKSTWAEAQGTQVVSSDSIRIQMTPDGYVPGDQSVVFREVRSQARRLLSRGMDVIVDATHLKGEHRQRQAKMAPPDLPVRYVVINRPLADKQRDAGWREAKGIVESHDREFEDVREAVLKGDNLPNVTVVDFT